MGINAGFHDLRHYFAIKLLSGGLDIYSLQYLMGHRSIQTTAIYLHVTQEMTDKARDILNTA